MTLIWLGACIMALGGALSLADRRLRIGAPAPAESSVTVHACGALNDETDPARLAALRPVVAAPSAHAVQPDEMLSDPALEARARALSAELRCMVCQNQSIDDSDAPLARDIRLLIRERIAKGESNEAVRDFLVSRYGDFILLKPPFKAGDASLMGGSSARSWRSALSPCGAPRARRCAGVARSERSRGSASGVAHRRARTRLNSRPGCGKLTSSRR